MQQLIVGSLLYGFHSIDYSPSVDFEYVPKESNWEVDELAQVALGVKISE